MGLVNANADPVGLLEGIATTRAARRFLPEPVVDQALATMLFAATRGPSGSNRQPFRFVVLRDGPKARAAKSLIGASARRAWAPKRDTDSYDKGSGAVEGSPKSRMARTMEDFVAQFEDVPAVVLACLARYRPPMPTEGASVYPACQNLLLAARAIGYGGVLTLWHVSVEEELRALLDIPERVAISATLAIGKPRDKPGAVRRLPLSELVFEEQWGQSPPWAVDPPGTLFTSAGPPRHEPK